MISMMRMISGSAGMLCEGYVAPFIVDRGRYCLAVRTCNCKCANFFATLLILFPHATHHLNLLFDSTSALGQAWFSGSGDMLWLPAHN